MSRQFWTDLIERAVKTFAQTLIAMWGSDAVLDVMQVSWGRALSVAAGATLLSVLASLASLRLGNSGTASLTDAVVPAAEGDDPAARNIYH